MSSGSVSEVEIDNLFDGVPLLDHWDDGRGLTSGDGMAFNGGTSAWSGGGIRCPEPPEGGVSGLCAVLGTVCSRGVSGNLM